MNRLIDVGDRHQGQAGEGRVRARGSRGDDGRHHPVVRQSEPLLGLGATSPRRRSSERRAVELGEGGRRSSRAAEVPRRGSNQSLTDDSAHIACGDQPGEVLVEAANATSSQRPSADSSAPGILRRLRPAHRRHREQGDEQQGRDRQARAVAAPG